MLILAIDTALEACSAAIYDSARDAVLASESRIMARGHAEALMPILASVMKQAAIPYAALDRIAVTVGPGSFTGLRVGIAAARGIALATRKSAVGITTLEALAAPCLAADPATPVAAAIDGRHRHVYFQIFGAGASSPRLAPLADAVQEAADAQACLIGSGAPLLTASWPENAPPPRIDARIAPDIGWVARLGVAADPNEKPAKPVYLRAAEAHPQTSKGVARR